MTRSRSSARSRSRRRRRDLMPRLLAAALSSRCGVALAQRGAHRVAERQLAVRDDGPVGAEHELVDADLAQHRVDGAVAVGGDVEEDAGVADRRGRRGPTAARGAAAPGRRASRSTRAGAGARAGPRRRTRTTPSACSRRSRSAPAHQRRRAGAAPARGPGMDEQRRVAALERLEHRAQALVAGRVAERVGGDARAREPVVEQRARAPPGSGAARPTAAHAPNGAGSAATPSW